MNTQKVHNVKLTTEDLIHLVASTAIHTKTKNLEDLQRAIDDSLPILRLNNLVGTAQAMVDSEFDAYSTFVKLVRVLSEENELVSD